jgi:hypothetical protein
MRSVRTGLLVKYQYNSVARMIMWLASGHTVMLRATYSERLAFHACSVTKYPDQSSVVVFSLPKMA